MDPHAARSPGSTVTDVLADALAVRASRDRYGADIAVTIGKLGEAAIELSRLVRLGPLSGAHGAATGTANADGDTQKALDVRANEVILTSLKAAPVAYFASEEEDSILTLRSGGSLAVAVDPLDGSSNIDANISIGTIFSIFAASPEGVTQSFLRPGREQLAAGYFVYGPHTALVLATGTGTDIFVLDEQMEAFRLAIACVKIPTSTNEFAINASNYRHWYDPVRTFVDDCVAGASGPRGKNFNMRWVASLVAETHRIFTRGGVFLYPADSRAGYQHGRLRLLYEAAPIALLVEQAGGMASDGAMRILDKAPATLHERTPLIFGSAEKVKRLESYHTDPALGRDQSPLFRSRGLFST